MATKRKRMLSASPIASDNDEYPCYGHSDSAELATPSSLRSRLSDDTHVAPRHPLAGSSHTLGQAVAYRRASIQSLTNKTQFRIRKSLSGHMSCVNALAISRGQGRWLASGGDDCTIHLRDLFLDIGNDAHTTPIVSLHGHHSNIFSISWSAQNKYLFSTGNDSQILHYDVQHSILPLRPMHRTGPEPRPPLNSASIGGHDDSVPEISAHPTNPNLLLSCDDGGNLHLVDIRLPHEAVAHARSDAIAGFSSVQWNPNESDGNTFAAATCGRITGSTRLYDVRQCFASDPNRPLSSKDAVVSYHTSLMQNSRTRGLIAAAAETNSICFDPQGRFLASSVSRYHPTIYAINDPDPLATLQSSVVPDHVSAPQWEAAGMKSGNYTAPKKLSSCCTVKHGSFGLETQTGRLHYAIGSDDFRAYVFHIPSVDELKHRREFISRADWLNETHQLNVQRTPALAPGSASSATASRAADGKEDSHQARDASDSDSDSDSDPDLDGEDRESEVAYCSGSVLRAARIVRPAKLDRFAHVLGGGQSIINTALIHPTLPYIFTAGIMSGVDLHSAAPLHFHDVRSSRQWDPVRSRGGGTRPRFIIPLPLALPHNTDSEDEDSHDAASDIAPESEVGEGRDADEAEVEPGADGEDAGESRDDGTVLDFLRAMRSDPMYAGSPTTLDYQHDRHIGTYALSGLVSEPTTSRTGSSIGSAEDHDSMGIHSSDGSDGSYSGDSIHSGESGEGDEGDEGDESYATSDIDADDEDFPWGRSSAMGSDGGEGDEGEMSDDSDEVDDDLWRAETRESLWVCQMRVAALQDGYKRIRLFDKLLRRDELVPLTASFRKVPSASATPTCASCHRHINPDSPDS